MDALTLMIGGKIFIRMSRKCCGRLPSRWGASCTKHQKESLPMSSLAYNAATIRACEKVLEGCTLRMGLFPQIHSFVEALFEVLVASKFIMIRLFLGQFDIVRRMSHTFQQDPPSSKANRAYCIERYCRQRTGLPH